MSPGSNHFAHTQGRVGLLFRVIATLIAVYAAGSWGATDAQAHSALVETKPASRDVIQAVPREIVLTFNEPVKVAFGGVKIFGPDGRRIDGGRVRTDGARLIVRPDARAAGTYAVAWRVVSADSHPVRGAFTFDVRTASTDNRALTEAKSATKRQRSLEVAFAVARGVLILSVLLVVGGAVYAAWCDPAWRPGGFRAAAGGAAAAIGVTFVLDAAVAGGFSLSEAIRPAVLVEQVQTTYGRASIVRMVTLLGALVVAGFVFRSGSTLGPRARVILGVGVLPLAWSLSLAGHAVSSTHRLVALPLDMLHVTAAAVWVGGLAQLVMVLRRTHSGRAVPGVAVGRFSTRALGAVVLLVGTGSYATWERVGLDADAWFTTTYGQLLAVKLLLFGAIIPLAARNRLRNVPLVVAADTANTAALESLRRYVRVELALLVLVIGITGWLIASQPARDAVVPPPVDITRTLPQDRSLQLVIDPGQVGSNTIHVYVLAATGQPDDTVTFITATADNTRREFEGLNLELIPAGPGHYTSTGVTFPFTGAWNINVRVNRGGFSEERVKLPIRIARSRP
jgi:copper transport protein